MLSSRNPCQIGFKGVTMNIFPEIPQENILEDYAIRLEKALYEAAKHGYVSQDTNLVWMVKNPISGEWYYPTYFKKE